MVDDVVHSSFVSEIRGELASIEQLISAILQRQTDLGSRLALLECPEATGVPLENGSGSGCSSWASVVTKGLGPKKGRLTLPLFHDPLGDEEPLQLVNRFAPLQVWDEGDDAPPSPRAEISPIRPRTAAGLAAWSKAVKSDGASSRRKRTSACSNVSKSRSTSPSPSSKRFRKFSPPVPADSPDLSSVASVATASLADASHPPPSAAAAANASKPSLFSPPDYILVGDSIVRYVPIPKGISYSFSGAKVLDLVKHIPTIVERYPSAHTVIVHVGINDIRCRQSIDQRETYGYFKLTADYEALAAKIEKLGKKCIFSGPIPTLRGSSETFSRIYSADQWLRNFCSACGYGYISHFDSFWTEEKLYKYDRLHPNHKGITVLAKNFSCHISTLAE